MMRKFSCLVDGDDLTPYIITAEGIACQVGFNGDITSESPVLTLALPEDPGYIAGLAVKIGWTTTESYNGNRVLWSGKIESTNFDGTKYTLNCTSALATLDTDTEIYSTTAYTTGEAIFQGLRGAGVLSSDIDTTALQTDDNWLKWSAPSSTLGHLSGVASWGQLSVTGKTATGAVAFSFSTTTTQPILSLTDWSEYCGSMNDGISKSTKPLAYAGNVGMTVNGVFKADTNMVQKCYWPCGYDQWYECWIDLVESGLAANDANLRTAISAYDSSANPTSWIGWQQSDVTETTRRVKRKVKQSTVSAIGSALFGSLPGLIYAGTAYADKHYSQQAYTYTVATKVGALSNTEWADISRLGVTVSPEDLPTTGASVSVLKNNLEADVDLVNRASVVWTTTDNTTTPELSFDKHAKTSRGWGLTTHQFHGGVTLNHPDLTTNFSSYISSTAGLPYEIDVQQTIYPVTVAVDNFGVKSLLQEVCALAGYAITDEGRAMARLVNLYPTSGTVFDIPLTEDTVSSWTIEGDNKPPTAYQCRFRDAYGDDYDVTYSFVYDGAKDESTTIPCNYMQGNFRPYSTSYTGEVARPFSGKSWNGAEGVLLDRLSNFTSTASRTGSFGNYFVDGTGTGSFWVPSATFASDKFFRDKSNSTHYLTASSDSYLTPTSTATVDTSQPMLDITPIYQLQQKMAKTYGFGVSVNPQASNGARTAYQAVVDWSFINVHIGDIVCVALNAYKSGKPYVALVVGKTITLNQITLTVVPITSPSVGSSTSPWTGFKELYTLVKSNQQYRQALPTLQIPDVGLTAVMQITGGSLWNCPRATLEGVSSIRTTTLSNWNQTKGISVTYDGVTYTCRQPFSGSPATILTSENGFTSSTATRTTTYATNWLAGGVALVQVLASSWMLFVADALVDKDITFRYNVVEYD